MAAATTSRTASPAWKGDLVRAQMGGAYPLSVPLDVSIGVGRTWDDAGH